MKIFWHIKDYPPSIIKIAVHNVLWMYPVTLLPVSKQLLDTREGERHNETLLGVILNEWGMLIA